MIFFLQQVYKTSLGFAGIKYRSESTFIPLVYPRIFPAAKPEA